MRTRLFVALFLALLCLPTRLWASPHTLGKGLEQDVIALCLPYTLGGAIGEDGLRLWEISIRPKKIDFALRPTAGGPDVPFSLIHPEAPNLDPESPRSAHFLLQIPPQTGPKERVAITALFAAISKNDKKDLWTTDQRVAPQAKTETRIGRALGVVNRWSEVDGLVFLLLLLLLSIGLAVRLLHREPRWMAAALAGVTVSGATLRLYLAPESFLGAWPWSRLWPSVRAVAESSWMDVLVQRTGPIFLTDVIAWTHWSYAALMPLVLFAHASFLLKDTRMGLCAAFFVAFLPQHIRFSRAEDSFIPSLVLTSVAFAAIHAWLRDPSRIIRILAILALPPLLYMGYQLRPLNLAFTAVYLAAIFFLHPENAPRHRRMIGAAAILFIALASLPGYLQSNEESAKSVLSNPLWLLQIPKILLVPSLLVLTDVRITPPLLVLFTVAGVWLSWRSSERRVALFLLGWLLLFLVLHSVVTQAPLQPRYHMHLVVPFLLLASLGAVRLWERYRERQVERRRATVAMIGLLAISPLLHIGFIQDRSYSEIQEHAFVLAMRDKIPERCTIVEYAGDDARAIELRFPRIGALIGAKDAGRFEVIPAFNPGVTPLDPQTPTLDAILSSPPSCLYLYEGLACMGASSGEPCAKLQARFNLTEVARQEAPLKMYDSANFHPSRIAEHTVRFALYKVNGPSAAAP